MVSIDEVFKKLKEKEQLENQEQSYVENTVDKPTRKRVLSDEDIEKIKRRSKKTGSRISKFGKFLMTDKKPRTRFRGITLRDRSKDIERSRLKSETHGIASPGSLIYPDSNPSLSEGIRNNSLSSHVLMREDFFGESPTEKDFFGTTSNREILNNEKKRLI